MTEQNSNIVGRDATPFHASADTQPCEVGLGRRSALVAITASFAITACTAHKPRRVDERGIYCFKLGKGGEVTCTPDAVPSEQAEEDAKRFVADADRLTVVVVRKRWGDAVNRIPVTIDHDISLTTVPDSFVVLKLVPGRHSLSFSWQGEEQLQTVEGRAGQVKFVEIVGSVWAWGSSYRWSADDHEGARSRAQSSRLIRSWTQQQQQPPAGRAP